MISMCQNQCKRGDEWNRAQGGEKKIKSCFYFFKQNFLNFAQTML